MTPPRPRIPVDVHWRRFDSELVVLDLRRGQYFAFSKVAADVFEGIAAGRPVVEIESALVGTYEVPAERVHEDVKRLLEDLFERGLLEQEHA